MRRRSTEIRVGVAVVVAVIILIMGVMWIEKVSFSRKFVTYTVYFTDVGGLDPGDPVTVSGVNAGEVGKVILEPGRVKTDLLIEEGITLFDDCRVQIFTIGLMGEKYIGIDPGVSGTILPPGSILNGEYKAGMAEAIAGFGDVIEELNETVRAFRALVYAEGQGASLGEAINKIDVLATEILAILRENREDLKSTARSMRQISGDVSEAVGARKEDLGKGIEDFSRAAARLDSITLSLKEITDKVESGEGTIGKLVYEKKLHDDLEAAVKNLNALLEDVKAHPERYLKIEIF